MINRTKLTDKTLIEIIILEMTVVIMEEIKEIIILETKVGIIVTIEINIKKTTDVTIETKETIDVIMGKVETIEVGTMDTDQIEIIIQEITTRIDKIIDNSKIIRISRIKIKDNFIQIKIKEWCMIFCLNKINS